MDQKTKRVRISLIPKIAFMILILITVSMVVNSLMVIPKVRANSAAIYDDYAMSLAESTADNISGMSTTDKAGGTDFYASIVGHINIKNVTSSYAYLVDSDGTMLYHPNAEKIGTSVENETIKAVIADIRAGKDVVNKSVVYEYKGEEKLASYALTDKDMIVVVTADYDEVMKTSNDLKCQMLMIAVICVIITTLIGILYCYLSLRPIRTVTRIINQTAGLDFTDDPAIEKISGRGDELGVIAHSVFLMRENLKKMVLDIENSENSIEGSFSELQTMTARVNDMCMSSSATSRQLASGMEENASAISLIDERISSMQDNTREIDDLARQGISLSNEAQNRATSLKDETIASARNTQNIYDEVQKQAAIAIADARNVNRINEFTETIMEISSQTGLLAINASIEAARAGESGKGFAVVASEIRDLASETEKAVSDIEEMVTLVVGAVDKMKSCLQAATAFIGDTVISDYKKFIDVSERYHNDANEFKESMNNIGLGADELMHHMNDITSSIQNISTTISESARGISQMAAASSDISLEAQGTSDKVDYCENYIRTLDGIVRQFSL